MNSLRSAIRRRNARCFSSVENAGITDDTVRLLLRAHGRALLLKGNVEQSFKYPSAADEVKNASKVTVQSVLESQEKQKQKPQQQIQQPAESAEGLDLAILLGSLKDVGGDRFAVKKSDKWDKAKEKVARRRPVIVPPKQEDVQEQQTETRTVATQDLVESRRIERIELDVPKFEEEPFRNELECLSSDQESTIPPSSRSRISSFIERLKTQKQSDSQDHKSSEEAPTRRLWTAERQVSSSCSSSGQEALNAAEVLDLADDVEGSDISSATMKKLVRSFSSSADIINGSIKVLSATKELGFMPSTTTYSLLICLLLKAGDLEKATQLLEDFLDLEGSKLTAGICLTLIDAFDRAGSLQIVYILFLGMIERGIRADADTTEKIFSVLLRGGRSHQTFTLFQKCALIRSEIRVETCNFLMDCLGKAGNLHWAVRVFDSMRADLCPPNVTSYNILIKQYVKARRMFEARKMFSLIRRHHLTPDGMSYHYLISGLCKLKRKNHARRRFDHMKKLGLQPDTLTYTCLINCYGKLNEIDNALELFQEMKRINLPLDTMFFNSLLRAVGRSRKPAMAYNIFREMKFLGYSPDLWTYNLLFHALARRGRRKRASRAFQEMKEDGIRPDVFTYTAMIHCLGNAGRTQAAYDMLRGMSNRGVEPNLRTWNALLKGIAKEDVMDFALKVYKEMKLRGFKADNTTYSILLELSISLRDTRRVLTIQRDYRDSGLQPDNPMTKILQRSITYMRKDRLTPFDPEVLLKP